MSTVNSELKYLWTAVFEDGTQIEQPVNDHYTKHDDSSEGNPSAFRDVLDKKKESKLTYFYLIGVEKSVVVGVNLITGKFYIDSIEFDAHPQNLDLSNEELQIVFHREVRRDTNLDGEVLKHYVNRYFIGWQVKGKNITQTIAVG